MTDAFAASRRRRFAEWTAAIAGLGLIVVGVGANQHWLDQHVFPSFFLMRRWYVILESSARVALVVLGAVLALVARRRIGRLVADRPGVLVVAIVAIGLAIGAAGLVLGWTHKSKEWLLADVEPLRHTDPRLGWTFEPNRIGHRAIGGRTIEYAFDAASHRVRSLNEPVDVDRSTVLFTGESVMAGEGLNWDESIPGQVAAMMGIQSANLAVHGFATDQSFLRLQDELPRFKRPVAVVSLFMTALFGRNLDEDRPHLGRGLMWLPAVERGRLASLVRLIVPFRRDVTVERGVAVTREVFQATAAMAAERGATALIVVPQFNKEDDAERMLRKRVLDDASLPYLFVEFTEDWRLPGDLHPNARTARQIAVAIVSRLRAPGR